MSLKNEELIEFFTFFKERYLDHSKKRFGKFYTEEEKAYNDEVKLLTPNNIHLKGDYLITPNMRIYIHRLSTYDDFIEVKRIEKIEDRDKKLKDLLV